MCVGVVDIGRLAAMVVASGSFTAEVLCYRAPKSREILMFVTKKMANNVGLYSLASTMSTVKLCGVTALFGVFLETNKHQNLASLGGSYSEMS